jgi:hypothetical protein
MFPKRGNFFPGSGVYREAVAAALRAELGETHHAVKTVMQWTGANERTVKNWLSARRGPRGEHLICLLRHSDKVLEAVMQLAGRDRVMAGKAVRDARNMLAGMLKKIDAWLS